MSKQQVRVGIQTKQGSLSENCCTLQFVIEFIHGVQSATRLPVDGTWKSLLKVKRCWIEWRTPDKAEELIVVFNRNVINLYFTANKSTMSVYELL